MTTLSFEFSFSVNQRSFGDGLVLKVVFSSIFSHCRDSESRMFELGGHLH
jgi:hypothetical protein